MSSPYNGTSGSFTGAGAIVNITLGYNPLTIEVTNETDGIIWRWNAGYVTTGLTEKITNGAVSINYAAPVFSGTGQSSSGQVITTTDTQTMTADQCAGMWFVSATHGPYLIASNTAVTGASAVLTTYGTAPTTDGGTYKILRSTTPSTSTANTPGDLAAITVSGSGAGPNGFSISAAIAVSGKQISWVATRVGS